MKDYVEVIGYIEYDPDRDAMKKNTQYWCVLQLPEDLIGLYQYFLRAEKHIHMNMPAWGAHCSIVRGKQPDEAHQHLWGKYQYRRIKIRFRPEIIKVKDSKKPGSFYIINFCSTELNDIREELGLPRHPEFHFTIGRTNYD